MSWQFSHKQYATTGGYGWKRQGESDNDGRRRAFAIKAANEEAERANQVQMMIIAARRLAETAAAAEPTAVVPAVQPAAEKKPSEKKALEVKKEAKKETEKTVVAGKKTKK